MSSTTPPRHTKEHLDAEAFLSAVHPHLAEPWAVLWLFGSQGPKGMYSTEEGVSEVVGHGYHAALLAEKVATQAAKGLPEALRQTPPPPRLERFRDDVEAHLTLVRRTLESMGDDTRTWLEDLRSAFVVMDRLVQEWERLRSEMDAQRSDAA